MLLRHIAHALGFGTSIVRKENGSIGYSVRDLMSPFDYLITNKSINMSQTIDLENFFRQDLFLSTKEGLYPLYTTEKGFVQGVSGCYFSFSDDKLLDYDIKNESKLMYIDKQTLNVLSKIGWKVKDYDLTLQTKNLDETYFGNIYDSLCFSVLDNNGNQLHPLIWEFQAFNRQLRRYDTLDKSFETCYSLSLEQQEQDYLDESTYLQGNVFFRINKNGIEKKYNRAVFLDCRPLIKSYTINNVLPNSDNKNFGFDLNLNQRGAYRTLVVVSTGAGTILNRSYYSQDDISLHIDNVSIKSQIFIDIFSENDYGTTLRSMNVSYDSFRTNSKLQNSRLVRMDNNLNVMCNTIKQFYKIKR